MSKKPAPGLKTGGGFSGIVPVNSFPKWITMPGGDNRWRLYDEEVERVMETDGATALFRITRVLLGIPLTTNDTGNYRLQWNQNEIGQSDWKDL